MAKLKCKGRLQPAAMLAAGALACLGIAACGGSTSKDTSATNSTTSTSTSTAAAASGPGAGRFATIRSCLQKEGVKLPQRPAGKPPFNPGNRPGGGGFLGGGEGVRRHLPSGVSAEKLQAALKKCGGASFVGGRRSYFERSSNKKALTEFASCMRENGVKLPTPNTAGHGPVFDTKGIDTSSTQFKNAVSKCRSKLPGPFAGRGAPPRSSSESGA